MPKSKGKKGKGKNKSHSSWTDEGPENIQFMDSSVSSEEDDHENHYEIPNKQTNEKATPLNPPTIPQWTKITTTNQLTNQTVKIGQMTFRTHTCC